MCNNTGGIRMPLSEFQSITVATDLITLAIVSGVAYIIPRDQLANQDEWERMSELSSEHVTK